MFDWWHWRLCMYLSDHSRTLMRIFELQVLHWDQIMGSSFWKLIAMTPYKKDSNYKLKLDPRKLAATWHGKNQGFALRLPPKQTPCNIHVAIAQCVLQHHARIHAGITLRLASTRCRTPWKNRLRVETIQAASASHRTGAALHRRLQPLYTEKHKVLCSSFLPNTNPMQHSCSHYIAICNQGFHKHIELQPLYPQKR